MQSVSTVFPRLKAAIKYTPPSYYKHRMPTWSQYHRHHPQLVATFNFIHDTPDVDTWKITLHHTSALVDRCSSSHF